MTSSGDLTGIGKRAPLGFWGIVAALMAAESICSIGSTMIFVALSHLYAIYGDPAHVAWLITAFSLTSAATAAVSSRLGDLFGRRKVLLIMLCVALSGSLLSALATDLNVIIAGRALQGAAMAILPLAFGLLREHAPPRQLTVGVGMLGGTYALGVGFGAAVGGVIVDRGQWQQMFYVTAALAIVALVLTLLLVPRGASRRQEGPLDLIGGALFVVPAAMLLLALTNGKTWGWAAPITLALLLGGIAGLFVWVRHELSTGNPLIDVRLLAVPQIAAVNLTIFLAMLGPSLYPQVVLPMIQQPVWTGIGLGVSALNAGLLKLPTNLTAGAAAVAVGFLARRWGMRPLIIAAGFLSVAPCVWLAVSHHSLWIIMSVIILMLAPALNVISACAPSLIIDAAPPDRTSEATGVTQVLRALAMGIGSQLIAASLATSSIRTAAGVRFPDERAYVTTYVLLAIISLLLVITALAIPRPPRSPRRDEDGSALEQEFPAQTAELATSRT